jgi:hypothetical protein
MNKKQAGTEDMLIRSEDRQKLSAAMGERHGARACMD